MAVERTLTITWEDPLQAAEQARALSGLELMRRGAAAESPGPPIARLLGMRLTEADPGRVVFELVPGEQHYNPIGAVHGGIASTLLDSCMACAVHTTLPAGTGYTSLELKVNFVRPITIETGRLRAEGRVVHAGRRVATAEGRVVDGEGRLYAHGTTTCLILSPAGG